MGEKQVVGEDQVGQGKETSGEVQVLLVGEVYRQLIWEETPRLTNNLMQSCLLKPQLACPVTGLEGEKKGPIEESKFYNYEPDVFLNFVQYMVIIRN